MSTWVIPLYSVLFLWIVMWLNLRFNLNLVRFGIYPRTITGLLGVLFSPFIHKDFNHLINNSFAIFILLVTLLFFYRKIALKIVLIGIISSGLITWIIAREAYHIGVSGLIYLLISFIFFSGILSKNRQLTAISFIVVFLYGSLLWYMLPIRLDLSWEGHLAGFIVGIVLAFNYRKTLPEPDKFEWEKDTYEEDDFDRLFDENGNFTKKNDE